MATWLGRNVKVFHFALFFCICLMVDLKCTTQLLIPKDEVETLQIIFNKLGVNRHWTVSSTSCNYGSNNYSIGMDPDHPSNITCDCTFEQGTVCHVTQLNLKRLNLNGFLPEELSNLTYLQKIDISSNCVHGALPKTLSKIALTSLAIVSNRITGCIPDEIGQITTLEEFVVEDNLLEGHLPESLGNLKNLKIMDVAGNNLIGKIPETFVHLKNLTELRLSGNRLSGNIPDFVGTFIHLDFLDFQGTSMEGPIPSTFSNLTNLKNLIISDLNTKGANFPNLRMMKNLKYLVIRNCSIIGPIPDYIGTLANLKILDLSYNHLSQRIPSSMRSLEKLQYMFLTNNSFSGPLPSWMLMKGSKTYYYDLSYNNFTGTFPESCDQSDTNLVASHSSSKSNLVKWCFRKDLPCSNKPQYSSLFINCGGAQMDYEGRTYKEDAVNRGPSTFVTSNNEHWAYSSTGVFLFNITANFLATDTSNNNVTSIYHTARLAPLSLKYYCLCMRRGSYNVKLHFAEIMISGNETFNGNGRRFFDVAIQGNIKLKDFNIAEEAGGVGIGITKDFDVFVNESTLEISLYWSGRGTTSSPNRGTYGPLISGITVTPNFNVNKGLSGGAIAGIILSSCVILVSLLVTLTMKGYFGRTGQQNEALRRLGTGYFTLRQIKAATDDFSLRNFLGEGGFGPVYKGVLPDGKVIAVKQLSCKSKQGSREFVNEIGMISALQHPNLVKLYGCCIEGKELLLVYEYMENNSLARALFGNEKQILHLDWQTRKSICLGIARGLTYLHEGSRLKIIHRDIKATNVLLDKNLNAKISDFGLAKLDEDENSHISTRIAGTIGYMAPEYATRGYISDKADVYSFGVVVLEIVSGTSNTSYRPKEEFIYLLDWAYVLQVQGNLLELVDPTLGSSYLKDEALRLLDIAILCTNPSPSLRPSMSSVTSMIEGEIPIQAPIVKSTRAHDELRFESFESRPQDNEAQVSAGSSMSSQVWRSMSIDGQQTDSLNIMSMDDTSETSALTST